MHGASAAHSAAVLHAAEPSAKVENVEGLNVMEKGGVRDRILHEFEGIGYRMKASLLRAADHGVPQLRKRMFFLGWRDGVAEPHFPTPGGGPQVTVADAIFDLPPLGAGQVKSAYEAAPRTPYQVARRKDSVCLHNHEAANHPDHLVEILRHIPDGGRYSRGIVSLRTSRLGCTSARTAAPGTAASADAETATIRIRLNMSYLLQDFARRPPWRAVGDPVRSKRHSSCHGDRNRTPK